MTELGPEARALLDAAREGGGPSAEAIRRMRGKIEATVATGAATSAVSSSLAGKLGLLGVVAAIAIGAFVVSRRGDDAVAPRVELAAAEARLEVARSVAPERAIAVAASPDGDVIEMAPVVRAAGAVRHVSRAAAVADPDAARGRPAHAAASAAAPDEPAATAPRPRADLAREVELVDLAMAALRRGDLAVALSAVRAHGTETAGAGQLAEDAAAIEIEALCRLDDSTAAAKLAAFDARWPQSAQRARLSTRCK